MKQISTGLMKSILVLSVCVGLWSARSSARTRLASPLNRATAVQENDSQKKAPILVTLRTDKLTYLPKARIHLEVLLTNVSTERLYIRVPLDWGESASLSLWASESVSKKEVEGGVLADAATPLPQKRDDFVQLLPNHILGISDEVSLEDLGLVRPGKYDLEVDYHSPVPAEFSLGLPAWSREQGSLRSNVVRIEVKSTK